MSSVLDKHWETILDVEISADDLQVLQNRIRESAELDAILAIASTEQTEYAEQALLNANKNSGAMELGVGLYNTLRKLQDTLNTLPAVAGADKKQESGGGNIYGIRLDTADAVAQAFAKSLSDADRAEIETEQSERKIRGEEHDTLPEYIGTYIFQRLGFEMPENSPDV